MNFVLFILLGIGAVYDIREKKVPVIWIWLFIIVMGIYRMNLWRNGLCNTMDVILALMPGMLIYLFSCIGEGMGEADGLIILGTGLFFSWQEHMGMLCLAFFLVAGFSIGVILLQNTIKNRKIPFVPFLFSASLIILCI